MLQKSRTKCDSDVTNAFATYLADLRNAHFTLLSAMEALDVLSRDPLPAPDCYNNVRWKLSSASLSRRMQWGKIYRELMPLVAAHDAAALKELQAADVQMLHQSAVHVSKWTPEAVKADWDGYCKASRTIRWKMKACIGTERRVLYPMLERLARTGSRCS